VACTLAVGDERAVGPGLDLALPRLVAVEDVVEDAGAAGLGQELGPEADQPAGRDAVLEPDPARAVVDHLLHPALAQAEQLGHHADVVLRHVDREALERLVERPVDLLGDHRGLPTVSSKPSRRIVSTSTASCSSPRPCTSQVSGRSVGSTRSETLPTSSCCSRFSIRRAVSLSRPCRRAGRCSRRASSRGSARRPSAPAAVGVVGVGEGLADRDLVDAGDGDDVAGPGLRRHPVEGLGEVQLAELDRLDGAVRAAPGDVWPRRTVPCWMRQRARRPR
jgi:hypothetical protein